MSDITKERSEETDESAYWMELIIEGKVMPEIRVTSLLQEANELTAIFAATHKTVKANTRRRTQILNQKS